MKTSAADALAAIKRVVAQFPSTPDEEAIATVRALRHRTGARRDCRCAECRAIVRVAVLATEALAMKAARARRGEPTS